MRTPRLWRPDEAGAAAMTGYRLQGEQGSEASSPTVEAGETAHLLRSPVNAQRLLESLAQAQRGELESHELDLGS